SVDAARQSVELVTTQYEQGIVDFDRVFVLQLFLTQQQDQLAIVQGSVAQNLIQLYKALGGGWQIRLNMPEPLPPVEPNPAPETVLSTEPAASQEPVSPPPA
ncbi:MAG: TolC family protein, partial [Pirellulales bacterium]|nr:TolC family protein [Pirellulales bacterium]